MVALLATLMMVIIGFLACAYGAGYFASIDSSDTATSSLVATGLAFAVPGVVAVGAGSWLMYRRLRRR